MTTPAAKAGIGVGQRLLQRVRTPVSPAQKRPDYAWWDGSWDGSLELEPGLQRGGLEQTEARMKGFRGMLLGMNDATRTSWCSS